MIINILDINMIFLYWIVGVLRSYMFYSWMTLNARYFLEAFLPMFLWPWWAFPNVTIVDAVLHFEIKSVEDYKQLFKPKFWCIFVNVCVYYWNNQKYHILPLHTTRIYTMLSLDKIRTYNVSTDVISRYSVNILSSFDLV